MTKEQFYVWLRTINRSDAIQQFETDSIDGWNEYARIGYDVDYHHELCKETTDPLAYLNNAFLWTNNNNEDYWLKIYQQLEEFHLKMEQLKQ